MSTWQNKDEFKTRVREWAQKLDVSIGIISFRVMKNKWASFTKKSNLFIFDIDLIHMDKHITDYVIVHELLHFRVPNHGKLWKSYMSSYLPDWEFLDKVLRNNNRKCSS